MGKFYSAAQAEKFYDIANNAQRPILVIETSDTDFTHLSMALKAAGVANPVSRCGTVAAALGTAGEGVKTRDAAFVLFDLDMPDADGRDLLQLFRQQERKLPVIVLSSSSHPDDVAFCYRAGANTFLAKPLEYDQWMVTMSVVAAYWLRTAILPAVRHLMQFERRVTTPHSQQLLS